MFVSPKSQCPPPTYLMRTVVNLLWLMRFLLLGQLADMHDGMHGTAMAVDFVPSDAPHILESVTWKS